MIYFKSIIRQRKAFLENTESREQEAAGGAMLD
jgi:hypothetical protein